MDAWLGFLPNLAEDYSAKLAVVAAIVLGVFFVLGFFVLWQRKKQDERAIITDWDREAARWAQYAIIMVAVIVLAFVNLGGNAIYFVALVAAPLVFWALAKVISFV